MLWLASACALAARSWIAGSTCWRSPSTACSARSSVASAALRVTCTACCAPCSALWAAWRADSAAGWVASDTLSVAFWVFMGGSLDVERRGNGGSAPLDQTEDKGQHGHDDEDEKEDLGYADGPCGNAAKAEDRCNQSDDQKNHCVMQHVLLLGCVGPWPTVRGGRQSCRAMDFTVGPGDTHGCRWRGPGPVGAAAGGRWEGDCAAGAVGCARGAGGTDGRVADTWVPSPGRELPVRRPPAASTRWRMPTRPWELRLMPAGSKPTPSSRICTATWVGDRSEERRGGEEGRSR